jgi:hypothetical protein
MKRKTNLEEYDWKRNDPKKKRKESDWKKKDRK